MRFLNGFLLIFFILLLSSFVLADNNKIVNVSSNDYDLKTKDVIECNRPDCFIDVELCKKNENKLSKKDVSLYFDEKGQKKTKTKIKSKNDVLGCEILNFNVEVPLFSVVKYGVLYEGLDLDPFINNTYYQANFTSDVNNSNDVLITDNNITSTTTYQFNNGLHSLIQFDNNSFDEIISGYNTTEITTDGIVFNDTDSINGNYSDFYYSGAYGLLNDRVDINPNVLNDLVGDSWTWNCFIKPQSTTNTYFFNTFKDNNNYHQNNIISTGEVRIIAKIGGAWTTAYQSVQRLEFNPDVFGMITIRWNSSDNTSFVYINGSREANPAVDNRNNFTGSEWDYVSYGASATSGVGVYGQFDGILDECTIWNYALTDYNISEIYNNTIVYGAGGGDGLYNSKSFLVNGSMVNFTPTFNTDSGVLNISFDNGSSYYNNVISGTTYNLTNSSYMTYNVFLPSGSYFSDFIMPLSEIFFTNISAGIINESLIDYNFSFYEGNNFRPYVNFTNSTTGDIITGAVCTGKIDDISINFSYNATTQNYLSDDLFINYSFGTYLYNVTCSKTGYNTSNDLENITILNTAPIVDITFINSVYNGLQTFSSGVSVTTFSNFSQGNITISVFDYSSVFSNLSLLYPNGSIISSVINQSLITFNLSQGNYNLSVFANDTDLTTSLNDYFVVSLCVSNWSRTDTCSYPDINTTIEYEDLNVCGDVYGIPADNGSSEACEYVSIEGEISCVANPSPLIKTFERIEWLCYLNNTGATTTTCISYVSYNDSIIQTNPKPEYVQQVGLVDYFTAKPENSNYQSVNIYFDNKDLIDHEEVVFGVRCNSEVLYYVFEMNVTPHYKELSRSVVDRGVWLKNNMPFVLIFLAGIIVLVIIAGYIIKKFNESRR